MHQAQPAIQPGQRVYWLYSRSTRYEHVGTVVTVQKRTAHIRVRRRDGRLRLRWVKLARLVPARGE